MSDEIYLGDGLYALLGRFRVRLRAPRENGDHVVYLDREMMQHVVNACREQGMNLR